MNKRYYIMGLPSSGKTTFLAALGYWLIYGCEAGEWRLGDIKEFDYLSNIVEDWSKCEELIRTNESTMEKITIPLADKKGNEMEIVMPDQSGETFKKMILNRSVSNEILSDLEETDEIFMFINPSMILNEMWINDVAEEYRNVNTDKINMGSDEKMCAQSIYVEILQFLTQFENFNMRIKIVVSAWDQYETYGTPEAVVKEKLPLLWQYIKCNISLFQFQFWGISAQGGDLKDGNTRESLCDIENPCERIRMVNNAGKNIKDLSQILL